MPNFQIFYDFFVIKKYCTILAIIYIVYYNLQKQDIHDVIMIQHTDIQQHDVSCKYANIFGIFYSKEVSTKVVPKLPHSEIFKPS